MKIIQVFLVSYIFLTSFGNCIAEPQSILTMLSRITLSEDGKLNFTQLVKKYGHSAEQHEVVTEDGYILTVFRLPGEKPPVLLFHGVADSADAFVIRGQTSLAITLAEKGYDVWVGNNRGNKFGRRHVTLNPDTDDMFWDYSCHEVGYYDLSAIIDFIRETTGQDSIATISHSQGTTAHFVLASTRPEYNNRIKISILLAPVAFLNNLVPPVSLVVMAGPAIAAFLKTLNINEILQDHQALSNLLTLICSKGIVSYALCACGGMFPISGFDPIRLEPEFLNTLFGHYPAATSRKSLVHFDQIALRGSFAQYDYGVAGNLAKYGSVSPPDYDVKAVTMDAALLVGNNDHLARKEDVEHLKEILPNVVHYEVLEPELWSHGDFVIGAEMPKYLYPSIFRILNRYN